MEMIALDKELKENSYPGRGIVSVAPLTEPRQLPRILSWEEARTAATVCL